MVIQSFLHIFRRQLSAGEAVQILTDKYRFQEKPDIYSGGELSIKEIRSYLSNAAKRPLTSNKLILIIHNVQQLSIGVANTMLKIIEEPPPYLVIHLTTINESKVLPTIVSRCHRQRYDVDSVGDENIVDLDKLDTAERLSWARDMAEDEQCDIKLRQWLELLSSRGDWVKAQKVEQLYRLLSETNANRRLALEHFVLNNIK